MSRWFSALQTLPANDEPFDPGRNCGSDRQNGVTSTASTQYLEISKGRGICSAEPAQLTTEQPHLRVQPTQSHASGDTASADAGGLHRLIGMHARLAVPIHRASLWFGTLLLFTLSCPCPAPLRQHARTVESVLGSARLIPDNQGAVCSPQARLQAQYRLADIFAKRGIPPYIFHRRDAEKPSIPGKRP